MGESSQEEWKPKKWLSLSPCILGCTMSDNCRNVTKIYGIQGDYRHKRYFNHVFAQISLGLKFPGPVECFFSPGIRKASLK